MSARDSGDGYPDTWYAATGNQGDPRAAPTGEQQTRVCVIGGGLAGLSVALELARRNVAVTLLEARRIAWGASGRNGGFVTPGFAQDMDAVESGCGGTVAVRLYDYSRQGAEMVRRNVVEFAPRSLMGEGKYSVSRYPAAKAMAKHADELQSVHGEEASWLSTGALRQVIRSRRYFDAIYKPGGFHIHPLNYALAMAAEIERLGGRVFENSPARSLARDGGAWRVPIPTGAVRAESVVLCTSGYDNGLFVPVSRSVLPVATHVAVTEPLDQGLRSLLPRGACIADTGMACDYYRLVDEGRLLWGGRITTARRPPRSLEHVMRRVMVDVFPGLAGVRLDYAWSGLMGYCRHRMPVIRRLDSGAWVATAFGGHGLNTTAMAGELMATALAEADDRWRDFSRYDLAWHGGPAGRAAVQATYWWMQASDWLRERRAGVLPVS